MANINIKYMEYGHIKVSKESYNEHKRRTNGCQYATQELKAIRVDSKQTNMTNIIAQLHHHSDQVRPIYERASNVWRIKRYIRFRSMLALSLIMLGWFP